MVEANVQVRGGLMRDQLAALRKRPDADTILARIQPAYIEAIDRAMRVAWIDGEANYHVCEVVGDVLGLERGGRFYRESFRAAYDTPLFRTVVTGAMRIAGSDPGALYKMLPKGTSLVFRGFGTFGTRDREPNAITLEITDAPARAFEHGAVWMHCAAQANHAVLDILGLDGSVDVEIHPAARRATFRYRW
ncbi:MAG: hypothetical protein AAGA54_19660 [Myxococcota bacterium]